MELKQIPVNQILANFTQPREEFDKEKIKELAESILGNGLINPITVRVWKNQFMLVAGERRWRAYRNILMKIDKKKFSKIDAFVKEYKSDVDWQVESLIENWQREDLTSVERENFTYAIWKSGKFKTYRELEKRLGAGQDTVRKTIEAKEMRIETGAAPVIKTRTLLDIQKLEKDDRVKVLKQIEKGKVKADDVREYSRTIKKSPEDVKKALLSDEITVEQAERISKLPEKKRETAIKEVKELKKLTNTVTKRVEERVDISKKEKKSIFEILVNVNRELGQTRNRTRRTAQIMTKFLSYPFENVMTDMQKRNLIHSINTCQASIQGLDELFDKVLDRIK